jgi:MFS family permease
MLWTGMMVQGLSLVIFPFMDQFYAFILIAALLGTGTAMVYPTFLAAVADLTHPQDRAESVGVFRLWRDGGYAIGAIFSGVIADLFNISVAIILTGFFVLLSALWIILRMNRLNSPVIGMHKGDKKPAGIADRSKVRQ